MKTIRIFSIKHSCLSEPELVQADNIEEAIRKFNNYYASDYDVNPDGIESVSTAYEAEVIC